jgi:hypothetical protein
VNVRAIGAPVLARLPAGWDARAARAKVLDLDGFVAVITPPGTPWLPNGIALGPGPTVVWDPVLPALRPGPELAARGAAILRALGAAGPWAPAIRGALRGGGATRPPQAAIDALLDALAAEDRAAGGRAALALTGRGAGLTPEGDDLLAGVCAVAAAAGCPLPLPRDLTERTTPLSATLLELAAAGAAPRPLHALLDLSERRWQAALQSLERLGASSGRAIALGVGSAATLLGRVPSDVCAPQRLSNGCGGPGAGASRSQSSCRDRRNQVIPAKAT